MSIGSYDQIDRDTASGRSLEARVLIRSALRLQGCISSTDKQELFEAVSLNHRLWLLFYSEIEAKRVALPPEIARNILALANYVVSVTPRAFARDPEALGSLVSVNRRIAAGLSADAPDANQPSATPFISGATV